MTPEELRVKVITSLTDHGFSVNGHVVPAFDTKVHFKNIQTFARHDQVKQNKRFILENYDLAKSYFPNLNTINPENIDLELREVKNGSIEHKLYRWWNLVWWSVPYQQAYGRQMRFVIWDKAHNAPFGLIGLQSPVLKMAVRDSYLKIPNENLDYVINQSMQAQRLGALPPYNNLLGGKLAALLLTSNELRNCYTRKYFNSTTLLKGRIIDPELLFITTTSAFGKSSIYNRLKYRELSAAVSLGYTKGSGSFHISNEIYGLLTSFLKAKDINVSTTFGFGPSRKIKLIEKAFTLLDLKAYHYHNIQREFFLFPMVSNLKEVIAGNCKPIYYERAVADLTAFWKERWSMKRAASRPEWNAFEIENYFTEFKEKFNLS